MNDFDWFVWIEHSTPRYCQGLVKYTLPLRHIQKYFAKQNIAIKTASNVKYLLLLAVYTLFDEVSNYLNLLHLRETHNALQLPVFFFSFFSFFCQPYPEYRGIRSNKLLYRHFSGLFFFRVYFRTSRIEGEFPKAYLINIATCLFPHH